MKTVTLGGPKIRLVGFLYELLRDHVPASVIEHIVQQDEKADYKEITFTNGYLARYAQDLAARLTPPE